MIKDSGFGLGANEVGTYSKRAVCALTICRVLGRGLQLFAPDKEAQTRLKKGIVFLLRKDGAWTLRRANKAMGSNNEYLDDIVERVMKLGVVGRVC